MFVTLLIQQIPAPSLPHTHALSEEPRMTPVTKMGRHWRQKALTLTDTHLHVGVQFSVRACVRDQLICDKRCSSWRCHLMTQPSGCLFSYHGRGSCRLNVHCDSHLQLQSRQPSLKIKNPKYPVELETIPGRTPPPTLGQDRLQPPRTFLMPIVAVFNFNIIKCFSQYKTRHHHVSKPDIFLV